MRAREPGVRRAQEPVQVAPVAVEPRKAEKRGKRLAERRLAERQLTLDRVRDAERRDAVSSGARQWSTPGRRRSLPPPPAAGAARARAPPRRRARARRAPAPSRKRIAPSSRRRAAAAVGEERALEVGERRRRDSAYAAAAPRCGRPRARARSSAVRAARRTRCAPARTAATRSPRCGRRAPRAAPTARRSGPRSRSAKTGRSVPGVELAGHALGGVSACAGRGPRGRAGRARRDTRYSSASSPFSCVRARRARLELGERRAERIGEAGEARGAPSPSALRATTRRGTARAAPRSRPGRWPAGAGDPLEEVVERPDRPAEQAPQRASRSRSTRSTSDPFGTISIGSRSSARQIALEEQRDLARVRGPCEQRQPARGHRPIVDLRVRRLSSGRGSARTGERRDQAAAAFGRRPRRAAAWPGILPAQSSQRSACFEPRRASVYVQAQRRAFAFVDFLAAVVADENRLACH